MLTFRDFIIEDAKSPDQVARMILDQCMPFVNAVGEVEYSTILYRGTESKVKDFVARPRSAAGGVTSQYKDERGQMIKEYFKRNCSIDLERLIFATADADFAATFGNPYVIFPIGDFRFAYSTIGKYLPDINTPEDLKTAKYKCGLADDNSDDGLPNPDFQQAVNGTKEILIQGSGYLPISLVYWQKYGQKILEDLSFR